MASKTPTSKPPGGESSPKTTSENGDAAKENGDASKEIITINGQPATSGTSDSRPRSSDSGDPRQPIFP